MKSDSSGCKMRVIRVRVCVCVFMACGEAEGEAENLCALSFVYPSVSVCHRDTPNLMKTIIWYVREHEALCLNINCIASSEAPRISLPRAWVCYYFLTFIYPVGVCGGAVLYVHTVIKNDTLPFRFEIFCSPNTSPTSPAWNSLLRLLSREFGYDLWSYEVGRSFS